MYILTTVCALLAVPTPPPLFDYELQVMSTNWPICNDQFRTEIVLQKTNKTYQTKLYVMTEISINKLTFSGINQEPQDH